MNLLDLGESAAYAQLLGPELPTIYVREHEEMTEEGRVTPLRVTADPQLAYSTDRFSTIHRDNININQSMNTNPFITLDEIRQNSQQTGVHHTVKNELQHSTTIKRETTEEILKEFTSTLSSFMKQITGVVRQPVTVKSGPTYTYSGSVEEDPIDFLNSIEDYLHDNNIRDDRERVSILRAQLTGDARRWLESFKNVNLSFTTLRECFLQKFDSPDCKALANISYFADKQTSRETAEVFLTRKRALMSRLNPNISTATAIGIYITQLSPEIGHVLRGTRPCSYDELIKLATSVENGLTRDKRNTDRRTTDGPSTPCRYCQAWHFHNECPRNPYKNQNNQQGQQAYNRNANQQNRNNNQTGNSGNWRNADGVARRNPPPAREDINQVASTSRNQNVLENTAQTASGSAN